MVFPSVSFRAERVRDINFNSLEFRYFHHGSFHSCLANAPDNKETKRNIKLLRGNDWYRKPPPDTGIIRPSFRRILYETASVRENTTAGREDSLREEAAPSGRF